MLNDPFAHPIRRRTILQAGLALGAMQVRKSVHRHGAG